MWHSILDIAPMKARSSRFHRTTLPSVLSMLETATVAANLPAVAEADMLDGAVRGVIGVEWKGDTPRRTVFQRLDSRYVLRRQTRRLMLAGGRFVRDERPGIESLSASMPFLRV